MGTVQSKDGTLISYHRLGSGPAVILVGGGLTDRSENAPLAQVLAEHFTVYNYDRRGRGESGDTQPYALTREIEDIAALVAEAGEPAHLFGVSSGGALVLETAAAGIAVGRIAVYEVPYLVDAGVMSAWQEYVQQLNAALAAGRRGTAVELFMRLAGSSEADIEGAKTSPWWPGLEQIAPTLAYDAACLGDGRPPTARLATITQPTLVATGAVGPDLQEGMAGLPPGFFDQAADAIVASVPHAERLTIEGSGHVANPETVAPALRRFFTRQITHTPPTTMEHS
jgi:pimeloyl-ACP methyl ester carboxylesterase